MLTTEAASFMEDLGNRIERAMRIVKSHIDGEPVKRTKMDMMHDAAVFLAQLRTGRLGERVDPHPRAAVSANLDELARAGADYW